MLGEKADLIFALDAIDLSTSIVWLGILCYTFQIYFDFSGYSDMAIGLGAMMGFKFPENFNSPYVSQSITEFWRRWHITLSSWMRDYLYIPLGGNRVDSQGRVYLNLWLVFLISGLWHGASWNFIIWGCYHGIFIIADRLFLNSLTKYIGEIGRVAITFVVVVLSWVLFRAEDLGSAMEYYGALFSMEFSPLDLFLDDRLIRIGILALIMSFAMLFKPLYRWYESAVQSETAAVVTAKGIFSFVLIFLSVASLTASDLNPFIYFRF